MTGTEAPTLRPAPSPVRRSAALLAFAGRSIAFGWAFRAARLYAWAASFAYIALAAAWSARDENIAPSAIVARALLWIAWAGGLAAWVLSRGVEARDDRLGITALAALRGVPRRALMAARVAATAWLVARVVMGPGIVLSVAVAVIDRAPGALAALLPAVIAYAALFGMAFGGLARLASRLNPRHGRVVFLALVLGPEMLRGVFDDMPTLVTGFSGLADLLFGVGGLSA